MLQVDLIRRVVAFGYGIGHEVGRLTHVPVVFVLRRFRREVSPLGSYVAPHGVPIFVLRDILLAVHVTRTHRT